MHDVQKLVEALLAVIEAGCNCLPTNVIELSSAAFHSRRFPHACGFVKSRSI
jgi:hypothetical protein